MNISFNHYYPHRDILGISFLSVPHNFVAPVERFRYFHLFAICVLPCGGSYQSLPCPTILLPWRRRLCQLRLSSPNCSQHGLGEHGGHGRHKYMACFGGGVGGGLVSRQTRIPGYWMPGYQEDTGDCPISGKNDACYLVICRWLGMG